MADTAREFFAGLEARIDPERTRGKRASYRFDIAGEGSWRLQLDDGFVTVSESGAPADCVLGASAETFLRIVRGEQSPTSAFMTGKIQVEGDMGLALGLRDLLG